MDQGLALQLGRCAQQPAQVICGRNDGLKPSGHQFFHLVFVAPAQDQHRLPLLQRADNHGLRQGIHGIMPDGRRLTGNLDDLAQTVPIGVSLDYEHDRRAGKAAEKLQVVEQVAGMDDDVGLHFCVREHNPVLFIAILAYSWYYDIL